MLLYLSFCVYVLYIYVHFKGEFIHDTGLTDILEWVGKAFGIDDDVRASFSESDAAKMLSIARYWISSGGTRYRALRCTLFHILK